MRADRLVAILLLLQVHGKMTTRALAERLEVSERTVHRDLEALGAAGIPVVAERGAGGGWSLAGGYRTNLTGLGAAEIQALFLPQPQRILQDLGMEEASEAARLRLSAALPDAIRLRAEYVRQRIHVDATGWHQAREEAAHLPALQEAVFSDRRVRLSYERADGTPVERLVDPLGLVAKGRAWYLAGATDGEVRSYRVSRVRAVHLTDEPAARPPDFDLAAWWAESTAQFVASLPRYIATVRAEGSVLPRVRHGGRAAHIEAMGEPEPDGWVRLTLRFDTEEEACGFALSFHRHLEVLEPPSLRALVRRCAADILARYGEAQT